MMPAAWALGAFVQLLMASRNTGHSPPRSRQRALARRHARHG